MDEQDGVVVVVRRDRWLIIMEGRGYFGEGGVMRMKIMRVEKRTSKIAEVLKEGKEKAMPSQISCCILQVCESLRL